MKSFIKFPLVTLPSLISLEFGLSLLVGYAMAFFLSGRETKLTGILPSLKFRVRTYQIHLHHWLTFSLMILISMVLHFSLLSPFLFYGTLAGISVQGILQYEDWHVIVKKI